MHLESTSAQPTSHGPTLRDAIERAVDLARQTVRESHRDIMEAYLKGYCAALPEGTVKEADPRALVSFVMERFAFLEEDWSKEVKVRFSQANDELPFHRGGGTVIETRLADAAFIVKTLQSFLRGHGINIQLGVHPVIGVSVGGDQITAIDPAAQRGTKISQVYLRVSNIPEDQWAGLRDDLTERLRLLLRVNAAYRPTLERLAVARERLAAAAADGPRRDRAQVALEVLDWLADESYIFLGYAWVAATHSDGRVKLQNGLGLLGDQGDATLVQVVEGLGVRRIGDTEMFAFYRTDHPSKVRSTSPLRYIAVQDLDLDGTVRGVHVFVGLLSRRALLEPNSRVPLVRDRIQKVLDSLGVAPGTYSYQRMAAILDSIPKEELFYGTDEEIRRVAIDIHEAEGTDRSVAMVWRRPGAKRISTVCVVPRARYSEQLVSQVSRTICEFLGSPPPREHRRVSDDQYPVRMHFYISTYRDGVDDAQLEVLQGRINDLLMSWEELLQAAIFKRYDGRPGVKLPSKYLVAEASGSEVWSRYEKAFTENYRGTESVETALGDIDLIEKMTASDVLQVRLTTTSDGAALRIASPRHIVLNDVVPVLNRMGLRVSSRMSEMVRPTGRPAAHLTSFEVSTLQPGFAAKLTEPETLERLSSAIHRVVCGRMRIDNLLGLSLSAGLTWREIDLLVTYRNYFLQVFTHYTPESVDDTLLRHFEITALMVRYFTQKFSPDLPGTPAERAAGPLARLTEEFTFDALDKVSSIKDDVVLRLLFSLLESTVRTNFYRMPRPEVISIKIDSHLVDHMPRPRPRFEIYVHGLDMEGIHLRGGMVARGGLRHSDRPDDFRTEVHSLQRTQTVKNAVIVPAGSKGGFITRNLYDDRQRMADEVVAQYTRFIQGLLDVTDNYRGNAVIPPPNVVRYDGDDPYLVVAADKGTAHLSDTANKISQAYGFWLDDAFASGGSAGYDHKKMGITSRGGWTNVLRHFRELGVNLETTSIRVAGVGDMSGDVFGNGMLRNDKMKLVAAFNHRHIFIDPDPDPAASFAERERLFALPRSAWSDYTASAISAGGGIYERSAKAIDLSPEARAMLRLGEGPVSGPELIQRILTMDVDLVWFGGIGTYVKASTETHGDVGDKANDGVRVDASQLRCKVIGEGANLAITQLGRTEYNLAGGRSNTDALDNSAGVNCSDNEVNIKILLQQLAEQGVITSRAARDVFLAELTDDVAANCIRNNYLQGALVTMETMRAKADVEPFVAQVHLLEQSGLIRAAEFIPGDEQLREWHATGVGLPRNLVAILVGYSKNLLYDQIIASAIPDLPFFQHLLTGYFPRAIQQRYGDRLRDHRLRREIITTVVTNTLVNQAGLAFLVDLAKEGPVPITELVVRYFVCDALLGGPALRAAIHALDYQVPAAAQYRALLELEHALRELMRWWVWNDDAFKLTPRDIEGLRAEFELVCEELFARQDPIQREKRLLDLRELALAPAILDQIARLPALPPAFLVLAASHDTGIPIREVVEAYHLAGEKLHLDAVESMLATQRPSNVWERRFRAILERDIDGMRRAFIPRLVANGPNTGADFLAHNAPAIDAIGSALKTVRTSGLRGSVPLFIILDDYRALLK